jgi:hypothetical protein
MTHDSSPRLLHVSLVLAALLAVGVAPLLAQDTPPAEPTPETSSETTSQAEALEEASEAYEETVSELRNPRTSNGELVRIFSDLVVAEDEVIDGDAVCVGGDARVAGRITGELVVVLGSLDLSGEVEGGAVVVMSDAVYREGARIDRELIHVMGDIEDEGADLPKDGVRMELFGSLTTMILWFVSAELLVMLVVFGIFALAAPRRIAFMSEQSVTRYGMTLLIGALIHIGVTIVNVTLVITVIGIPIAILLDLVFRVLRMYGRTALLHALGAGLGRGFGRSLSVLGAVLLGFFALALFTLLPLFFGLPGLLIHGLLSALIWVVIDCPAVGVLALTKLGDASPPPASPSE